MIGLRLKDYLGAHSPNQPLNACDEGQRDAIYTRLANWVAPQLAVQTETPSWRHQGPRFELAITLRARRDHWEHSFSLPPAADFARPALDCPVPEVFFGYGSALVDGEFLFQLLFGSDPQFISAILGAAFNTGADADPTRYPLLTKR